MQRFDWRPDNASEPGCVRDPHQFVRVGERLSLSSGERAGVKAGVIPTFARYPLSSLRPSSEANRRFQFVSASRTSPLP